MKVFSFLVLVLAVVAMMMGGAQAAPKGGGLGKAFSGARKVIGAVGAIGTGAEIADRIRNRHNG